MSLSKMNAPERNAVLAGLRLLQLYNGGRFSVPAGIDDIITNGGDDEALGNKAIDALCESINFDGISLGEPA